MPQLSPQQLEQVRQWAAEGANLNSIQDRLKTDFGITLTYMEARLLVLDMGVNLKDKPREVTNLTAQGGAPPQPGEALPPEGGPEAWPEAGGLDEDEGAADQAAAGGDEPTAPQGASKVTLSADQIAIPGTMISGKVTFSDGQTAAWYLDQMGRLGLASVPPNYQPPRADIPVFQRELDRLLQRLGF